jgi:mycothiol synthase
MGFDRRPLTPGDVGNWAALLTAIQDADGDDEYASEQDLRERFEDPARDFATSSIAVYDGPTLAGYGVLMCRGAADPVHDMLYMGGVHPSYRGRGLGGELLDWAEHAAAPLSHQRFPGHPLSLATGCPSTNAAAIALYEQRGYQPVRWFQEMVRDLSVPVPPPVTPAGVRITAYRPDLAGDALLVRNESFRDHWGSTQTSPEHWAHFLASAAFRPQFSFLACEEPEPLGMLIARESEAYHAHTGRRDVHIALVGTRAAARKRGIATALLLSTMAAARADGYDRASLDVDSDSLTGAVRLYEHLGFTVASTWILYRKQLSEG